MVLMDEITDALNGMEETGKVDLSIVKNLDKVTDLFKASEEKWLTTPNTKQSFYFYYAARNAELVLSKMKERFMSSKQVNDNPKVAEDSLQIVGLLGDLLDLTRIEKPDDRITKLAIERVRQLRAVAADTKLLQSEDKELEGIDKEEMAEKIDTVMGSIIGAQQDAE